MQTVDATLQAMLDGGVNANANDRTFDFEEVIEVYSETYVPPAGGFDPTSAVEKFASTNLTWNGIAYRRECKKQGRGAVSRFLGKTFNSVSITFSNVDRYLATFIQSTDVEGMRLVVRLISRSITSSSIVLFAGRIDKPVEFDRITAVISAKQDLGGIEIEIPPRYFTPDDPNGRTPDSLLYEGFRFTALGGSFDRTRTETSRRFFIFRRTRTVHYSDQWSATDGTPYGDPVPEVLGRCQVEGIPIAFADIGGAAKGLWVYSNGKVAAIENIRNVTDPNRQPNNVTVHLGDIGGTGTNATPDQQFPNADVFSKTAYIGAGIPYGDAEFVEEPISVVAVVRGKMVTIPDASGVFNTTGFTDNPAYLARFLLTDSSFGRIPVTFIDDTAAYETGQFCDEPLMDSSNGERVMIPDTDLPQAGESFLRYRSTGVLDSQRYLYESGLSSIAPELIEGDYEGFDETDPPSTFAIVNYLRKRYTANVTITDKVKLVDFLYDTLFRAARLYLVINARGKIEIRSERPADNGLLRSSTIVGATQVAIDDVSPWKTGALLLRGKVLIGFGLITSEVRTVTSATYSTASNSITLVAAKTGTITATASGATFSGGTTSVSATGTVTIGGTPAAGNTVTVTIDGRAVTYTLIAGDTTSTVARMVRDSINADETLKRFVKATWASGSPTVVTITSKLGLLNVAALANAHASATADPAAAPVLTQSAGGSLAAGIYKVAYTWVMANGGETLISPIASINVTASNKIDVASLLAAKLAAGASSVNFYMSLEAGSDVLRLAQTGSGVATSINGLPVITNAPVPWRNSTYEEVIRVMMSFSDAGKNADGSVSAALTQAGLVRANITKDSFKWPLGSKQSSINQVIIKYREAKDDFALTELRVNDYVHQAKIGKVNPLKIDGAAIDNYHQASRIANSALSKNREGDWFASWSTSDPNAMLLEEGDVVSAGEASGGLVNEVVRVEEVKIDASRNVSIVGRRYSTNMFSDTVVAHTIPLPTTLRYVQTSPTELELIDAPPIRDEDAVIPAFYAALSRDTSVLGDWRASALYADYGSGYQLLANIDTPATFGVATTTLASVTDASVFDRTNTLTLRPKYGTLLSSTETEVLATARKNLILYENEYLQYVTATDNLDGTFTISTLLRGRFGTDIPQRLTHTAAARFVLMDGSERLIPIDPVRLNTAYNYKAVTTNQNIADVIAAPSLRSFTWTGGTVKPLAPANLGGHRNDTLDILYTWHRRSRAGQSLRPMSDVPLAEEREAYSVDVLNGSDVVVRTIPVDDKQMAEAVLIPEHDYNDITGVITNYRYYSAQILDPTDSTVAATITEIQTANPSITVAIVHRSGFFSYTQYAIVNFEATTFGMGVITPTETYNQMVPYLEDTADVVIRIINGRMHFYLNPMEHSLPLFVSTYQIPGVELRAYYFSPVGDFLISKRLKSRLTECTYKAEEQTADGFTPGNPIKVRVYQVSQLVGRGDYSELIF